MNDEEPVEDLDVPESEAEDVKGGGTFLKLDGIKGESLDDKHKDQVEVLSFKRSGL